MVYYGDNMFTVLVISALRLFIGVGMVNPACGVSELLSFLLAIRGKRSILVRVLSFLHTKDNEYGTHIHNWRRSGRKILFSAGTGGAGFCGY
jgi:hypothetical protein